MFNNLSSINESKILEFLNYNELIISCNINKLSLYKLKKDNNTNTYNNNNNNNNKLISNKYKNKTVKINFLIKFINNLCKEKEINLDYKSIQIFKTNNNNINVYCSLLLEAYNKNVLCLVGKFNYIIFIKLNYDKIRYKYLNEHQNIIINTSSLINDYILEINCNNTFYLIISGRNFTIDIYINNRSNNNEIKYILIQTIYTLSDYCKMIDRIPNSIFNNHLNTNKNIICFAACFAEFDKTIKIYKVNLESKVNSNLEYNISNNNNIDEKESFDINNCYGKYN